jgi:hypothetical protein
MGTGEESWGEGRHVWLGRHTYVQRGPSVECAEQADHVWVSPRLSEPLQDLNLAMNSVLGPRRGCVVRPLDNLDGDGLTRGAFCGAVHRACASGPHR